MHGEEAIITSLFVRADPHRLLHQLNFNCHCIQLALKQLLRKLEKEKVEIEWQLKEMEWRLDQESTVGALMAEIIG